MAGHLFMSYSRADKQTVGLVIELLISEGFSVWWDHEIAYGALWEEEIEAVLTSSGAVIVAMSGSARQSDWVEREIALAGGLGKPIFPILLEGEPDSELSHLHHARFDHAHLPRELFVAIRATLSGEISTSIEPLCPATDERLSSLLGKPVPDPNLWGRCIPIPGLDSCGRLWTGVAHESGYFSSAGSAPFIFKDCVLWHVDEAMQIDTAVWLRSIVERVSSDLSISYLMTGSKRQMGSVKLGDVGIEFRC